MKNLFFCFFALFLPLGGVFTLHAEEYPVLSQDELTAYYSQLQDAIGKAEAKVQEWKVQMQNPDRLPAQSDKVQFQHAIVQLEVKKTLFANFKGTESLRSSLVRQKLLEVLNNPAITEADLAELQSLVLEEKQKIRASKPNP